MGAVLNNLRTGVRTAFTLVEVLLSLAIAGVAVVLVAGVMVVDEGTLSKRPPEAVFYSAIKRAKIEAAARGRSVCLSFDERGFFLVSDAETSEIFGRFFLDSQKDKREKLRVKKVEKNGLSSDKNSAVAHLFSDEPDPADFENFFLSADEHAFDFDDDSVRFVYYQIYPKLVNSASVKFPDEPIHALRVAPDGTMTRAKVEIRTGGKFEFYLTDAFCGAPQKFDAAEVEK